MKFLFSTINNRSIALLFGVAFCAISAFGQSPFSAYSRFGIGTPARPGSMTHFGMGGVSTPITDGTLINFSNPASYSFCSLTTLQVNATGSSITATSTDASTSYNYGQVNELGMLFKKPGSRWAFAAGLSPYSLINYNFRESENLNDSAKVNKIYNGSGGLNKATIGTSRFFTFYKTIIRKDSLNQKDTTIKVPVHQISVGANVNVLFGTLQRENLAEFQSSTTYNTKQISKLNNKGILFDIGLLYRARLAKKEESGRIIGESHLYVGLDYNMQTKLRSVFNENYTRYVYSNGVAVNGGETYTSEEVIGKMTIPQRISLGVAFRKSAKKWGRYTVGADFKYQDWGDYSVSIDSTFSQTTNLDAASTISLGIEYEPSIATNSDFFHRLNYRAGVRHTNTHLNVNGTMITESAVSIGLSIPVIRSFSRFHIGAEYMTSGTTDNNLIAEKGFNFMVGFTLTPSERWFFQRKYD